MDRASWEAVLTTFSGQAEAQGFSLNRKGPSDNDWSSYVLQCRDFQRTRCSYSFRLKPNADKTVVVASVCDSKHAADCPNRGVVHSLAAGYVVWRPFDTGTASGSDSGATRRDRTQRSSSGAVITAKPSNASSTGSQRERQSGSSPSSTSRPQRQQATSSGARRVTEPFSMHAPRATQQQQTASRGARPSTGSASQSTPRPQQQPTTTRDGRQAAECSPRSQHAQAASLSSKPDPYGASFSRRSVPQQQQGGQQGTSSTTSAQQFAQQHGSPQTGHQSRPSTSATQAAQQPANQSTAPTRVPQSASQGVSLTTAEHATPQQVSTGPYSLSAAQTETQGDSATSTVPKLADPQGPPRDYQPGITTSSALSLDEQGIPSIPIAAVPVQQITNEAGSSMASKESAPQSVATPSAQPTPQPDDQDDHHDHRQASSEISAFFPCRIASSSPPLDDASNSLESPTMSRRSTTSPSSYFSPAPSLPQRSNITPQDGDDGGQCLEETLIWKEYNERARIARGKKKRAKEMEQEAEEELQAAKRTMIEKFLKERVE